MFWILLIPPLLVPFVYRYYFQREYTLQEMGLNATVAVVLTALVYGLFNYRDMLDYEILNGKVTDKNQVFVSCEHSYSCNCRQVQSCSTVNGKSSCSYSTVCDTCYEHTNDWDWQVNSTVGSITIDRVDSRGTIAPPRFKSVVIGEPFSTYHGYTNYIKASPDSIFHYDQTLIDLYKDKIPAYPRIYDYYTINRVINNTSTRGDTAKWNDIINHRLTTIGTQKEVNIIVVITDLPPNYADALFYSWSGGKKNDVLMVYGVSGDKIEWFNSTSIGNGMNNKKLHYLLRDLAINGKLSDELIEKQLDAIDLNFVRLSMSEFEYLKDQREIPIWVIAFTFIISMCGSIGIGYMFTRN